MGGHITGHGWSWKAMVAGHGMAGHGQPSWLAGQPWLTIMDWSVLAHESGHVHRFFATILTPALPAVLWHASALRSSLWSAAATAASSAAWPAVLGPNTH